MFGQSTRREARPDTGRRTRRLGLRSLAIAAAGLAACGSDSDDSSGKKLTEVKIVAFKASSLLALSG